MSYRFATYEPALLSDFLTLQRALWGQNTDVYDACFRWKYLENPYIDGPKIYFALSGDDVVGVRGFHGAAWRYDEDGSTLVTPTGGDTVVVPEHRNRMLFEKIDRFAKSDLSAKGFSVLCNFSAAPVTFLRSVRSGWRAVGPFTPLARDRTPGSAATGGQSEGVLIETDPRPAQMANLVQRVEDPRLIRPLRDRTFFEWRFRYPLSRYLFLYAGSDPLDGFMVLQKRLFKAHRGMRIVDWEARDGATFERLLAAAIADVDCERLTIWSATLPDWAAASLTRVGFRPYDDTKGSPRYRPGPLVARTVGSSTSAPWTLGAHTLTDPARWRLRMLCSDSC